MVTVPQLGGQPGIVTSVDIEGHLLVELGTFTADQGIVLTPGDSRTMVCIPSSHCSAHLVSLLQRQWWEPILMHQTRFPDCSHLCHSVHPYVSSLFVLECPVM
jgi:hypothetical protein